MISHFHGHLGQTSVWGVLLWWHIASWEAVRKLCYTTEWPCWKILPWPWCSCVTSFIGRLTTCQPVPKLLFCFLLIHQQADIRCFTLCVTTGLPSNKEIRTTQNLNASLDQENIMVLLLVISIPTKFDCRTSGVAFTKENAMSDCTVAVIGQDFINVTISWHVF